MPHRAIVASCFMRFSGHRPPTGHPTCPWVTLPVLGELPHGTWARREARIPLQCQPMFALGPWRVPQGQAWGEPRVAILRPYGSDLLFAQDPVLKWLLHLSRAVSTSALNLTTLIPFPRCFQRDNSVGTCKVLEWDESGSLPSQEAWKIPALADQPVSGCTSGVEPSLPAHHLCQLGWGGVCVRPGGDALVARARRQPRFQQREKHPLPPSLFLVRCLETDYSLGNISALQGRLRLKIETFAYFSTRPPSCTQEGRLSRSSVTQLSPLVQWFRVLEQRNQRLSQPGSRGAVGPQGGGQTQSSGASPILHLCVNR